MKTPLERIVALGMLGSIVALGLMFAAFSASIDRFARDIAWVKRLENIGEELDRLLLAVAEVESSVRNYAATGDDAALEAYRAALPTQKAHLARLRSLDALNSTTPRPELEALARTVDARLAEAERVVELRRTAGATAAEEAVAGGAGERLTGEIRRAAEELRVFEKQRLRLREAATSRGLRTMRLTIFLGTTGIATLLALGVLLLRRTRQERDRLLAAERAALEEARASAERLRLATEASNTALWDWDLRTNDIYFSPIWKRQIGYAEHEIPDSYDEWRRRVHVDDLAATESAMKGCIARREPGFEMEFRFRHKDGSYRWILVKAAVVCDEEGRAIRVRGSHLDLTERKQAAEQMEAQLRELQRWHEVTLGREERVQALKREVNELLARQGQPARYPSQEPARAAVPSLD